MTLTTLDPTITQIFPYEEGDEQDQKDDHRTHIINPPMNLHIWKPGMATQDIVDIARFGGLEIFAICGYRFVPKRNPEKYDVCENCMKEAQKIMSDSGE